MSTHPSGSKPAPATTDDAESRPEITLDVPLHLIRGEPVVLDKDIARLFGRTTHAINQTVKRNKDRFPDSYAFQLTPDEWQELRPPDTGHGGDRKRPWAYTEPGFSMLATRLRGDLAARISRVIVDTFVAYRRGQLPPGPVVLGENAPAHRRALKDAILQQMTTIARLPVPGGGTVSTELQDMTARTLDRMKALLDRPKRTDEKLIAEIGALQAETEKALAEARRTDAETALIWAEVIGKRLEVLATLRNMAAQLERDEIVETYDQVFGPPDTPHSPLPRTGRAT